MSDLHEEAQRQIEIAVRARSQFVHLELQVCLTCLEMARLQFTTGNLEFARKELSLAQVSMATVERFCDALAPAERADASEKLGRLKQMLEDVIAEFQIAPPPRTRRFSFLTGQSYRDKAARGSAAETLPA